MKAYKYDLAPLIAIPGTREQGAHRATIEFGQEVIEIFCGVRGHRVALLISGGKRLLARGNVQTLVADVTRVRGAQLPGDVVEALEELLALLPDGGGAS